MKMLATIWATSPVEETPEIILGSWRVMQLDNGDRHFVGYNLTEHSGRASSKIVIFDPVTKQGVTASGRIYKLQGEPGWNADAFYVWGNWCRINRVAPDGFTDISDTL